MRIAGDEISFFGFGFGFLGLIRVICLLGLVVVLMLMLWWSLLRQATKVQLLRKSFARYRP